VSAAWVGRPFGPLATEESFLEAAALQRGARDFDREVLTFRLATETYGLDIRWLREIVKLRAVTEVPRVPRFVAGIITVRGVVVPVVDLRRRIGLPEAPGTKTSRILVTERDEEPMGFIVDEVHKVVRMHTEHVEEAGSAGAGASELVGGIARIDRELIILLDYPALVRFSLEVKP
jgi:purine-binding chemotaxis protein CheW